MSGVSSMNVHGVTEVEVSEWQTSDNYSWRRFHIRMEDGREMYIALHPARAGEMKIITPHVGQARWRVLTPYNAADEIERLTDEVSGYRNVYEAARWLTVHMPAEHVAGFTNRSKYEELQKAVAAVSGKQEQSND